MVSAANIKTEREAKEAKAVEIAATLPLGLDYYADGKEVGAHGQPGVVYANCESHWDACAIMLAAARR